MPRVRVNNTDSSTTAADKMHEVLGRTTFPYPIISRAGSALFGDIVYTPLTPSGWNSDTVLSGIRIQVSPSSEWQIRGRGRRLMVGRSDSSMDTAQLVIRAQLMQDLVDTRRATRERAVEDRRVAADRESATMARVIDGVELPRNVSFQRAHRREEGFTLSVTALLPEQATALLKHVEAVLQNPEWDDGI